MVDIRIVAAIAVAIAILGWAISNPQQAVDTVQNLFNAGSILANAGSTVVNEICPIPDRVMEGIDESITQALPDEESKQLLQKIRNNEATDCEIWEFLNLLDDEQRKRMNLLESLCNVKDCVMP